MKNVKLLAAELGRPEEEMRKLALAKLPKEHYRKSRGSILVSEEGEETLRLAVEVPLAVPTRFDAIVLRQAPNPRFVYAKIVGKDGAVPVVMPARLAGKMVGKRITIDAITDATGTTYRHESLGRAHP